MDPADRRARQLVGPGRGQRTGQRLDLDDEQLVGPVQDRVHRPLVLLDEQPGRDLELLRRMARTTWQVTPVQGRSAPDRCPAACPAGRPVSTGGGSAQFADTTRTTRSGSLTAIRTPCGWIEPGMWIGSSAQVSRSAVPSVLGHVVTAARGVPGDDGIEGGASRRDHGVRIARVLLDPGGGHAAVLAPQPSDVSPSRAQEVADPRWQSGLEQSGAQRHGRPGSSPRRRTARRARLPWSGSAGRQGTSAGPGAPPARSRARRGPPPAAAACDEAPGPAGRSAGARRRAAVRGLRRSRTSAPGRSGSRAGSDSPSGAPGRPPPPRAAAGSGPAVAT